MNDELKKILYCKYCSIYFKITLPLDSSKRVPCLAQHVREP